MRARATSAAVARLVAERRAVAARRAHRRSWKPALCRVRAYSVPGLPSPTISLSGSPAMSVTRAPQTPPAASEHTLERGRRTLKPPGAARLLLAALLLAPAAASFFSSPFFASPAAGRARRRPRRPALRPARPELPARRGSSARPRPARRRPRQQPAPAPRHAGVDRDDRRVALRELGDRHARRAAGRPPGTWCRSGSCRTDRARGTPADPSAGSSPRRRRACATRRRPAIFTPGEMLSPLKWIGRRMRIFSFSTTRCRSTCTTRFFAGCICTSLTIASCVLSPIFRLHDRGVETLVADHGQQVLLIEYQRPGRPGGRRRGWREPCPCDAGGGSHLCLASRGGPRRR